MTLRARWSMLAGISPKETMSEATPASAIQRGFIPDELVRRYFTEWNISRQCATGAGGVFIPEFADGPDGAFYANQLGFGRHNPEKDVVQTSLTLRSDNNARKRKLKEQHEDLQRALKREAKERGIRVVLEPWREPEGCTGCESCVAGARVAPRVIRLAGSFVAWTPFNPNASGRRALRQFEQDSKPRDPRDVENAERVRRDYLNGLVVRFAHLRAAAERKSVRDRARASADRRAVLERKRRQDDARAQMQAKYRADDHVMKNAERRARGTASMTRR